MQDPFGLDREMIDAVFGPPAAGEPDRALVQLLTPEGERVEHADYAFDPSAEQLRAFYRDMLLIRRLDTEATALQPTSST